jgi:type I restriction enzyme M protein
MKAPGKKEALSVSRLINEVLVGQLSIPFRQIVNDTTFQKYTGSKRPDLLISEFEYDKTNDDQFIKNLVAYAEVKDTSCTVGDSDWQDGMQQGQQKAQKLGLPYFIVTNCKTSIFYNANTLAEMTLNKNPIREFQTIDILRLLKNRIAKSPTLNNIQTNVDSISTISEAIFNKKLWELATVYRGINFKDTQQKIDFTIGFVSLEFFEEKAILDNTKDSNNIYWSSCLDDNDEKLVANLDAYIRRLAKDTDFKEFKNLIDALRMAISGNGQQPLVSKEDVRRIYETIDSMRPLHGAGFDLFGAVYEMFASSKEKKEFGEYFTRRHYAHVLAKLLLHDRVFWDKDQKFTVLDPACGTGGFLTEGFKVIKNNYERSGTFSADAKDFIENRCFYGIDVRDDNISRTRLNMFLVGDGHTNMRRADSLKSKEYPFKVADFNYVITNPPYGYGTVKAETTVISTVRTEIAFLCRIRQLLTIGGHACVIQPDGVLENPSWAAFRTELLQTFDVTAIISLPKFAFAPYTKEKTYAVFLVRRSGTVTKIQEQPIWMYIIDNDGLANSDKRFPTKRRNNRNGWMHDEISGWVSTSGDEKAGILEERWLKFDDLKGDGTEWVDERGIKRRLHKGGFIDIQKIVADKYTTLLPEYYFRPYQPTYITLPDLEKEMESLKEIAKTFGTSK